MPHPVFECAFRPVDVVGNDGVAHIFCAEIVFAHRVGVEFDPHRGQRTAAHRDLADACYLRQFLRQDSRCRIVHLAARHGI